MAVRLAKAFGGGAEVWLRQQADHDLWHAEKRLRGLKLSPPPHKRAAPSLPSFSGERSETRESRK